jgi:predicted ArsR family transcriptional regulator
VGALIASVDLKGTPMTNRKSTRTAAKPKTKASKTDQLKSLLAKPYGMTVETLSTKLSWQTHTTRAALTRLKQAGVEVEKLDPADGSRQSRYRIAGAKK